MPLTALYYLQWLAVRPSSSPEPKYSVAGSALGRCHKYWEKRQTPHGEKANTESSTESVLLAHLCTAVARPQHRYSAYFGALPWSEENPETSVRLIHGL